MDHETNENQLKRSLLPAGWHRIESVRKKGVSEGKIDIYIKSPGGKTLRSKRELEQYIKKKGLSLNINDFDFSNKSNPKTISRSVSQSSNITEMSDSSHEALDIASESSSSDYGEQANTNVNLNTEEKNLQTVKKLYLTKQTQTCDVHIYTNAEDKENDTAKELLKRRHLTDLTIQPYLDILNENFLESINCIIVNPLIVHGIKNVSDSSFFTDHLNLDTKRIIILPINDSDQLYTVGSGIHWSTLIYEKKTNKFYYLDSIRNLNLPAAKKVADNLTKLLNIKMETTEFLSIESPQQSNGIDCGVFMCWNIESLVHDIVINAAFNFDYIKNTTLTESDVINKRAMIAYVLFNSSIIIRDSVYNMMVVKNGKSPLTNTKEKNLANQNGKICSQDRSRKKTNEKQKNRENSKMGNGNNHPTKPQKKNKVHVYADSHGIALEDCLSALLPSTTDTFVYASSGGTTSHILNKAQENIKDFTKDDVAVIISGANDICDIRDDSTINIPHLYEEFASTNQHTNIVYITQFHRHDMGSKSFANREIYKINQELKSMKNLNIVNTTNFKRNFFAQKGLHLSKFGKQVLSRRVVDQVLDIQLLSKQSKLEAKTTLKVVEADMESQFEKYCQDPNVAFAHCISADFDNQEKHMSRGVAVAFREQFGRPSQSDYCGSHLTSQRHGSGATVYSLVTKQQYFQNANNLKEYKTNYDLAFSQMTEDFINRRLSTLICSPLGCIRDRVLPSHFVTKLLEFKKKTGASIYIITCNDSTNRNLCNGLSYNSFMKYLQHILVNQYLGDESNFNCQPGDDDQCNLTSSTILQTTTSSTGPAQTSAVNESGCIFGHLVDSDDSGGEIGSHQTETSVEVDLVSPNEIVSNDLNGN